MFNAVEPNPNFSEMEEALLKFWEKEKIFEKSLEATKKGRPFTFYDGPPFATGLPHYGHILASTIKDLVPRYQTMNGRFVRRRWGWDCHGLPIEEIVERKLKISGKKQIEKIGIKKFNETCRSMVLEFVSEWRKTIRRIARWVDFDSSYKTMDREYMESVWWAFKEIYKKGLVYEGRKVLLYCPRCETPVSNFEVAMDNSYQEVTEEAVTVKFKLRDAKYPNTYLLAWTTTPWTLPGNVAVAVGKDIEYVKVQVGDEFYILAKDRLPVIATQSLSRGKQSPGDRHGLRPRDDIEVAAEMKGKDLLGLEYEPLFDIPALKNEKTFRVYAGDFVTTEEGTGIVHTAVVYGEEDYALGMKEGMPVVPLLDEKGIFNEQAPALISGKYFKDAEKPIKSDLEKRGLLFKRESHKHSYPHCWRCGTALYYNALPAWFINIQKIKSKLLASNKKEINWYPEHLKFGRYAKSVEAAPDWNISRNRYWGNPIPVWRCEKCGKNTVVGSIAELKKQATAGYEEEMDLHRPYIDEVILKCEHCGGEAKRITEIFDSWMEAASMPFAEYHYPFENKAVFESRFPAQFVAEYIAQTRAWFYVMHVVSYILFDKAPFENVVTTGTILAEDGSKMSKSKNNYPDPWGVIEKYGVDSLRFYLMSSSVMQADNLNFSERDLAIVNRKVVRILWNVYNYFVTYANAAKWFDFDLKSYTPESRPLIDQWVDARRQQLVNEVTASMDKYDTVRATREIEKFISDLSTWYLRRSRGRSDQSFFDSLHRILSELSQVTAPFMPYLSEEIYRNVDDAGGRNHPSKVYKSVHLEEWPQVRELDNPERNLLKEMEELRDVVEQVHALRAGAGVKLRQPLSQLEIPVSKMDSKFLGILKEEVNVRGVIFGKELRLDTAMTPQLRLQGLTRELERQINQFRKEAGLRVGEEIDLRYETESANIEKAMEGVDRKKTYLKSISKIKMPLPHPRPTGLDASQGGRVSSPTRNTVSLLACSSFTKYESVRIYE